MSMKQVIINYLINKLERRERYWFYRGLLSLFFDEKINEKIITLIADWIYSQEEGKWVYHYEFTDIFFIQGKIFLHSMRPGFWIGRKGENIDGLLKYIQEKIPEVMEFKIIEDRKSFRARLFARLSMRTLDY